MAGQIDLNVVRILIQVVENGSYTAASRATGMPKSTISQRIAGLERAIGTGLLRRTSRSFSLTEAGRRMLPHARAIEDLARQLERSLLDQGGELQGTLRVSCTSAIAQSVLSRLLPRFLTTHGQAVLRLEVTNRLVDLVGEGFDMTIQDQVGPLKDSTLRQRVVARASWALIASPDWVAEHGAPTAPDDIPAGEVLCFSTGSSAPSWTLNRGEGEITIEIEPRLTSDDMAMLRNAAIAGGGITCLPGYMLRDDLRTGRLALLLPDWSPLASDIVVLTPPRAQSSRLAAEFSDFLARELPRFM